MDFETPEAPQIATARQPRDGYLERPRPSGLAHVIEVILDKGLVVDAYVRVSLVGIELLTIDARIVVASVDTCLRFAEAVDRVDIAESDGSKRPTDLLGILVIRSEEKTVIAGTCSRACAPRALPHQGHYARLSRDRQGAAALARKVCGEPLIASAAMHAGRASPPVADSSR